MTEKSTSLNILTERETAKYLKVSRALLQKQRREKTGPPYVKFGGCLRYRLNCQSTTKAIITTGTNIVLLTISTIVLFYIAKKRPEFIIVKFT